MDQFLCMYKLWFLRLALVSGGGPGTACIAAVSWGCDVLIDDEDNSSTAVLPDAVNARCIHEYIYECIHGLNAHVCVKRPHLHRSLTNQKEGREEFLGDRR